MFIKSFNDTLDSNVNAWEVKILFFRPKLIAEIITAKTTY